MISRTQAIANLAEALDDLRYVADLPPVPSPDRLTQVQSALDNVDQQLMVCKFALDAAMSADAALMMYFGPEPTAPPKPQPARKPTLDDLVI